MRPPGSPEEATLAHGGLDGRPLGFHEDSNKLENAFEFEGCLGPGSRSRTSDPFK